MHLASPALVTSGAMKPLGSRFGSFITITPGQWILAHPGTKARLKPQGNRLDLIRLGMNFNSLGTLCRSIRNLGMRACLAAGAEVR